LPNFQWLFVEAGLQLRHAAVLGVARQGFTLLFLYFVLGVFLFLVGVVVGLGRFRASLAFGLGRVAIGFGLFFANVLFVAFQVVAAFLFSVIPALDLIVGHGAGLRALAGSLGGSPSGGRRAAAGGLGECCECGQARAQQQSAEGGFQSFHGRLLCQRV